MKYTVIFSWLSPLTRLLMALAVLFSSIGINPAKAASAGTALQFNGTNQHVTFGNTRLIPGTLTASPTWNIQANSRLGSSSLTFNGSTQYVTFGAAPELGSTSFTIETWFYRTAAGSGTDTSSPGGGGLQGAIHWSRKDREKVTTVTWI